MGRPRRVEVVFTSKADAHNLDSAHHTRRNRRERTQSPVLPVNHRTQEPEFADSFTSISEARKQQERIRKELQRLHRDVRSAPDAILRQRIQELEQLENQTQRWMSEWGRGSSADSLSNLIKSNDVDLFEPARKLLQMLSRPKTAPGLSAELSEDLSRLRTIIGDTVMSRRRK